MVFVTVFLFTFIVLASSCHGQQQQASNNNNNSTDDEIGASTVEIVRSRGFLAKAYNFTTKQGYILQVVRCNNPLINGGKPGGLPNKSVVLMFHGLLLNSQSWIVNSVGAKPKNYGFLSAATISDDGLNKLLADDPTSNSFCLLLLNFGHECWLLDRRGTLASQGHTAQLDPIPSGGGGQGGQPEKRSLLNSTLSLIDSLQINLNELAKTVNPRYWNYSYDEQALQDLPQIIDFILVKAKRKKLSLLGYSAGGLMALAALSTQTITKEKLQHVMLWAPAMELGHNKTNLVTIGLPLLEPLLVNYLGPVAPDMLTRIIMATEATACTPDPVKTTACAQLLLSTLGGYSGDQQKYEPGFSVAFPDVSNGHELAQLGSALRKLEMDKFDYLVPAANRREYGQDKPPTYNISDIKPVSLSVWFGNTDALVTVADTRNLLNRFRISVEFHLINSPEGTLFSHFSFLWHKNVSQLLNIRALKTLERAEQ